MALAAALILVTVPQAAGVKVKVTLARFNPAGLKVSSKLTPVTTPGLVAGLVTLNSIVVLPPGAKAAVTTLLAVTGA